jgi:TonB-dependent SusC/RagA subfamily outer membrane receptor
MKKIIGLFVLCCTICLVKAQEVPLLTIGKQEITPQALDMKIDIIGNQVRTTYDMLFYNKGTQSGGELLITLENKQQLSQVALAVNGSWRTAVAVPKVQKGIVDNAILRQGTAPLKVLAISPNQYRMEIADIPVNESKRIVVSYDQELSNNNGVHELKTPLRLDRELDRFSLMVVVSNQKDKPLINTTDFKDLIFEQYGTGYRAVVRQNKVQLNSVLTTTIPLTNETEKTAIHKDLAFIYKAIATKSRTRPIPKQIDLYWDASYSMKDRDIQKEIMFLSAYFQNANTSVNLITFSNTILKEEHFSITNGNWSALKAVLTAVKYDGGTSFRNVFDRSTGEEILLFSDGIRNLGELSSQVVKPHFVINSSPKANHKGLQDIAAGTRGAYIDLHRLSTAEAVSLISNQAFQYLGYVATNTALEVYPKKPQIVGNDFVMALKNVTGDERISLQFGYGTEITETLEVNLKKNSQRNPMVNHVVGIQQLKSISNSNQKLAVAQAHNIIIPNTEMRILTSPWDYIGYGISPPQDLRSEYQKVLAHIGGRIIVQDPSNIDLSKKPREISGRLIDSEGMAIPQAGVLIQHTSNYTTTDDDGFYKITAKKGDQLTFKSIGYQDQEAKVGTLDVLNMVMDYETDGQQASDTYLDTVTITTAGNINRDAKALGYAADQIDEKDIAQKATGDITRIITGKATGVQVTQTSGLSGSGTNIIIRGYSSISGSNQALFIVDGVPYSNDNNAIGGAFANNNGSSRSIDMDPNNIASVSVLKGLAATTLYGSQGRNGVVLITTKTGSYGNGDTEQRDALVYMHDVNLKLLESKIKATYIKELAKSKSTEVAYEKYLSQRENYTAHPTYFVDVFEFFSTRDFSIANRILSNIAELYATNVNQLKTLAFKLDEQNDFDSSAFVYKQIASIHPKDINAARDVALAYQNTGKYKEAVAILDKVNERVYENEDKSIAPSLIANELNNSKRWAKVPEHAYVKTYNDLRIVAEWNDDSNIKLRVIDPKLEECSFENIQTVLGGKVSQNNEGPQEFTIKNAVKGDYYVHVDHKTENNSTSIPTFLKVTMYKNYGSEKEEKEVKVVRLDPDYDHEMLAKVRF